MVEYTLKCLRMSELGETLETFVQMRNLYLSHYLKLFH